MIRPLVRFRNLDREREWEDVLDMGQRLVKHGLLSDMIMRKFVSNAPCQGSVNVKARFTVDIFHLNKAPPNQLCFHSLVPPILL